MRALILTIVLLILSIVLLIGSPALGQQLKAITNSIGMKMVLIHPGSFTMPSRENLEARIDRLKPELLRNEAEIERLFRKGRLSPQEALEVQMLRRGEQSGK